MKYAFEVDYAKVHANPEPFVDAIFASLASEFLVMPKGQGFVDYPCFETGYETLKRATQSFTTFDPVKLLAQALETPITLIILRAILGFTPPEWAYVANRPGAQVIKQGFVRTLDRRIRLAPMQPLKPTTANLARIRAMVDAACAIIRDGCPEVGESQLHRLDKADTRNGLPGLRNLAGMGAPYAMLLYERFLGRPFAGHRDSVSELVGDALESAIEAELHQAGVSYRKTKRAEKIPGFDQAPDFFVPSEFNPKVVIEAKITEDDGTARDKVTRVQHLAAIANSRGSRGPRFHVIACIAGRGFAQRREDMRKLLEATRGCVFTPLTLRKLVTCSALAEFGKA